MKFQPITVTVTVQPKDLYHIAQMAIDTLEDDFGSEVVECAGVVEQELFEAIMLDKTFRQIVTDKIMQDGTEVTEDPWGYFDGYDFLDYVPGLKRVVQLCKEMDDIIRDANKAPEDNIKCIPVPNGYKLVRI